jgi:hypothetical protein
VVFGTVEVIATFSPARAFTSVDLPTFGRPATATSPLFMSWPTRSTRPIRTRPFEPPPLRATDLLSAP